MNEYCFSLPLGVVSVLFSKIKDLYKEFQSPIRGSKKAKLEAKAKAKASFSLPLGVVRTWSMLILNGLVTFQSPIRGSKKAKLEAEAKAKAVSVSH